MTWIHIPTIYGKAIVRGDKVIAVSPGTFTDYSREVKENQPAGSEPAVLMVNPKYEGCNVFLEGGGIIVSNTSRDAVCEMLDGSNTIFPGRP